MTQQPPPPGTPREPTPPAGARPDPQTRPATPPTSPARDPRDTREPEDPLRGSRTSGAWIAVVGSIVLIVLLVIFIVQNTTTVPIEFLWIDGNASLSVALLIATAVGMAIAALVGSLRILQLRRRVKREKKARG
jgi:uncharacterized integral membrane protein